MLPHTPTTAPVQAKRDNASHLTLVVPPLAAYSVSSPETVEVTVPAEALLQHHSELRELGSFVILATPGTATLNGSLLHKNESTRLGPPEVASKTLDVVLTADEWDVAISTNLSLQRLLVSNMRSDSSEAGGWSALIARELAHHVFAL